MKQEFNSMEQWLGNFPRINAGDGFYDVVEQRLEARLDQKRHFTTWIRNARNIILIGVIIIVNACTISFGLNYLNLAPSATKTISTAQAEVYYIDPMQYQVSTYLNTQP